MSNHIRILGDLPNKVYVACSGGVDSMAVVDFLVRGKRDVRIINFDHGTKYGSMAADFVADYWCQRGLEVNLIDISEDQIGKPPAGESQESHWHNARYRYYREIHQEAGLPIITCHHLDDQVENWIMTCATGNPSLISYKNEETGVIRPFLLNTKDKFYSWCHRKGVPFVEDPSNAEDKYVRNYVRNNMVKHFREINPGINKVIAKKILEMQ